MITEREAGRAGLIKGSKVLPNLLIERTERKADR